jgi:hypothetical protein
MPLESMSLIMVLRAAPAVDGNGERTDPCAFPRSRDVDTTATARLGADAIVIRCGRCGTRVLGRIEDLRDYVSVDCHQCAHHRESSPGRIAVVPAVIRSPRHG